MSLPTSPIAGALPELRNRIQDCQSALHFLPEPDSPIPGVIRFKRHLQARWDPESKRFVPLDDPRWVWEKTVLVLITAEELVDKIADADVGADVDVLAQWASDVRLLLGLAMSDQVVLMIKGLQKYYSKSRSLANKDYINAARADLDGGSATATTTTAAVNGRYAPPRPTRDQIEAEMVRLQVAEHFFLVHVEKTEDVEDWVYNIAADIALRPYKLVSKSHLNFAPAEGTKKALQPTAVLELMLQEVQGITASAAAGITEKYPTFRRLMEAFEMEEQRGGMERAEMMLQYCEVRNLKSGHASGRNLNKVSWERGFEGWWFFFFFFTYLVYSTNRHCRNGFTMRFVERTVSLLHDSMIHFFFWDSLFSDLYRISCIYQDFFSFFFFVILYYKKKKKCIHKTISSIIHTLSVFGLFSLLLGFGGTIIFIRLSLLLLLALHRHFGGGRSSGSSRRCSLPLDLLNLHHLPSQFLTSLLRTGGVEPIRMISEFHQVCRLCTFGGCCGGGGRCLLGLGFLEEIGDGFDVGALGVKSGFC